MNILLATPAPIVRDETTHQNLRDAGQYNDGAQDWFLYLCSEDVTGQYPGSKLIGAWRADGRVATDNQDPPQPIPIDPDYEAFIRPFGNADGAATGSLGFHSWLGNGQRHVRVDPEDGSLPQYPADLQPYIVTVQRTYIDDDGYPHIPHGFTFRINFADPATVPSARSFGVYADAECTQYLWTPGAFVDVDGVWTIECPVGQRTAEESEWHFAMLLGAAQEGRFTLPIGTQSMTWHFFTADQGGGGGGGYADSGQTVTGMAGTVTLMASNAQFNVGDKIRIDGHESTVTSKWTGTGLVLTPYKAHATGATIEVWQ